MCSASTFLCNFFVTCLPVALSVTVTRKTCSMPPSNPGTHWRWNVSDDLLITVQLDTGSGATAKEERREANDTSGVNRRFYRKNTKMNMKILFGM